MQVDKSRILHETLRCMVKLTAGEGLLLQPFKKDRAVCLVALGEGVRILEKGYMEKDYVVEQKKIKKELKILCRREFPRSNKLWLRQIGSQDIAVIFNVRIIID